ncbi:hypothetical protein [Ramlibacter sp.]|uniref:hypothetical protein n=1 Tax=Ramlibacter sp. TaxID=1917967 RepID=UPI003D0997C3
MNDMTATVHFSIKYDGPALSSHEMDVRELAPALLALSNLLEEANRAVFPDASDVRVHVKGDFKGGCFAIDLVALQSMKDQLVAIFSGPTASASANLFGILGGLGLLGAAGKGLIDVIKWLRGRRPTSIRITGDTTVFELRGSESVETFEVDLITGRLYQSRIVRQSLAKVVKPLEREGIDLFATGRGGVTEAVVTKEEARFFELAAGSPDVVSDTLTENVLLQIESAVFKEDNKWRFHDGAVSFFAEIADRDFLERIASGQERFGKGDVLIVDLRRVQSITDNGLKLEHIVSKVREHRAPLQHGLLS